MARKTQPSDPARPDGATDASDAGDAEEVQEDLRQFFESDDETWLDDLRDAETPQKLGTLGP